MRPRCRRRTPMERDVPVARADVRLECDQRGGAFELGAKIAPGRANPTGQKAALNTEGVGLRSIRTETMKGIWCGHSVWVHIDRTLNPLPRKEMGGFTSA